MRASFKEDGFVTELRRQEDAVAMSLDDLEADDPRPVIGELFDIRRRETHMSQSADLNHVGASFPRRRSVRARPDFIPGVDEG